jgi:5-methylcytosine-specific restriction endonuclease McrA
MPRTLHDWNSIQAYHDEGHGFVECARRFGFTKSAWNKAISRSRLRVTSGRADDRRRRYDWGAVQTYYDGGASLTQCKAKFGFSNVAWTRAAKRSEIRPRSTKKSIADVLASRSSRWVKKAKLVREGQLLNECSTCGISKWHGKPLAIQIDHINGARDDWRIENLRMLCPNCHSQTPTYSGRNIRRRRRLQEVDGSCSITVASDPG